MKKYKVEVNVKIASTVSYIVSASYIEGAIKEAEDLALEEDPEYLMLDLHESEASHIEELNN